MQRLIESPAQKQQQTAQRIQAGLERERQPQQPLAAAPAQARFVNPPPLTAPHYFQDRHNETGLLADYLHTPELRMVTVTGRGGLGKTAMVCRLLKALEVGKLPDDTPTVGRDERGGRRIDGIVYLSPTGGHPVSFPNLFADLCRLLPQDTAAVLIDRYKDPHETPTDLVYALLEDFPTGCTVLLLDNFEDHVDAGTGSITDPALDEALRALLTAPAHGVKVILTTRVAPRALLLTQPSRQRRLGLDEGLQSPYAENVLRASDPDGSIGLKTAPAEQLATARERTRGYPRALEALAAILAADRDTTLPELLIETARLPDNVVEALVGEAYNRLDPLAQQVMQALAVYPMPVPPVAVDYVLQPYRPAINAAPVLTRLVNMQFIRRDSGRYYLHQVDRDYALTRLPEDPDADLADDRDFLMEEAPPFNRAALQQRGADYYAQTRTPRETWKSIDDLAPQLAEYELRRQAGDYDTAASVLLDIDRNYLIRWGHGRYTLELHQRLLDHLADPWVRSNALAIIGSCHLSLDNYPSAIDHYQQALAISRDIGDRQGEVTSLGGLASCYSAQNDYPRAIDHYQQALAISRDIGDREGEAYGLGGLAGCYYAQNDYPSAIDHYQQALAISRDIGDREGEATSLGGLAGCYYMQNDYPSAIDHYQQALAISRDIGDRQGEAYSLGGLADCYSAQDDYPSAIDHYQQALAISRDIGDRQGEAYSLGGLASCYYTQDDYPSAIDHYQQALAISRDIGNRQGQATSLGGLADCYYTQDDYPSAIDHYQQALAISRDIGNRQGQANSLRGLADCYSAQDDYPSAIDHYQQALAISRDIGNRQGQANSLRGLASCYSAQDDYPSAIDHYQQALAIGRDIGDRQGEAYGLGGLADCYSAQGDYPRAIDHYQRALAISRDIGNRQGEANGLRGLADCYSAQGDYPSAIDHYQRALAISRNVGDRQGEAYGLRGLADCYSAQGDYPSAIDHYQRALAISRDIGNRQGEANGLRGLADCYSAQGDYPSAIDHYQQALAISRDIGNRQGEANSLRGLASCHADLGRTTVAIETHRQALSICGDIADQAGQANVLNCLGAVHATRREWQDSTDSCARAVKIADAIRNLRIQANARLMLATTRLLAGDLDTARDTAQASIQYNHPESRPLAHLVLGIARLRQGSRDGARHALTICVESADAQLRQTPRYYRGLEAKAVALCALSLVDNHDYTAEANRLFRAARAMTTTARDPTRNLQLLEALTPADLGGLLGAAHPAGGDEGVSQADG